MTRRRYPTPPPPSSTSYSIDSPSSSNSRHSHNSNDGSNSDDVGSQRSSSGNNSGSDSDNGRGRRRRSRRGRSPTPKETSSSVQVMAPIENVVGKKRTMKNKRKGKRRKRKKYNINISTNSTTTYKCLRYYSSAAMLFVKCIIFSVVVTFVIFYYILDCKEEVQMLMEEIKLVVPMSVRARASSTIGPLKNAILFTATTTASIIYSYFSSFWISIKMVISRDAHVGNTSKNNSFQYNNISTSSDITHSNNKDGNDLDDYKYLDDRDIINNTKIYELNHIPPYCKEKDALSSIIDNSQQIQSSTTPEAPCRNVLTDEMKASFEKDGVIAIRGLLSPELFNGLNKSSHSLMMDQMSKVGLRASSGKQFFMNKMGAVFTNDDDDYDNDNDNDMTSSSASTSLPSSNFRDVALSSLIPQVVSELLGMDYIHSSPEHGGDDEIHEENLRMLRDVLLIKDSEKFICGWHVDDLGFWPSTASSPGVNAWIAIDDMSSTTGGNFAVSVGTHNVPWRHEIYELTGSTMTIPEDGYKDVKDMFERRKGEGTCNIKNVHRGLHDKLEERKRVYDLKAGDIMFLSRWLFHRTIPYDRDLVKEKKKRDELNHLLSRRYSLRYAPGNVAELPRGYGTELSILWDEQNQGRTLNSVGVNDLPWYPKCWPHSTSYDEQKQIQDLIKNKLPIAEARRKDRINEMKPYLQAMGKQQRDKLRFNAKNTFGENQRNEL